MLMTTLGMNGYGFVTHEQTINVPGTHMGLSSEDRTTTLFLPSFPTPTGYLHDCEYSRHF